MPVADYESPQLTERLAAVLAASFPERTTLAIDELAGFDHFHTGGIAATTRLAAMLPLDAASRVLDVGSGLGGPARHLASTSGAHVTGIERSRSFVDAADMLNARTAAGDRVTFVHGDALELPFAAASFDAATMHHVAMNIEDRATLYAGIRRVLRPGGVLLTYDVVERGGEPQYPAPWARASDESFLLTEAATRDALVRAGFAIEAWEVTERPAVVPPGTTGAPPLAAILGRPDFGRAVANMAAGFADGRIAVLSALARRA